MSFSFETGKIDDWFQQNKFSFIPELTPSTSTQLFKARILVLGVTRSTVPHLTLLKRQKLNDAEYAFIGKDYAEYLKRVYSVGIEERIFIIRSSDDMFWTEKTGSYPEWIASIDQGLPGKSSVGYLMRGVRSAGKVYDDIKQVEGLNLIIMVGVGILGFVYVVYKFMIKRKDDDGYEKAD